jgi:DNA-binding MarR family transcriptional regulator
MENLNLTELERLALQTLIDGLYAEAGFSDVDANDIAHATGIDTRIIRGVLSSLVKKGFIGIDANDSGYQIIYLNSKYWYLHPEWKDQMEDYPWRL